jgi:hypothetical protein
MAELHRNLSNASSHVRLSRISEGNLIDEPFSDSEPSGIVFKTIYRKASYPVLSWDVMQ